MIHPVQKPLDDEVPLFTEKSVFTAFFCPDIVVFVEVVAGDFAPCPAPGSAPSFLELDGAKVQHLGKHVEGFHLFSCEGWILRLLGTFTTWLARLWLKRRSTSSQILSTELKAAASFCLAKFSLR